MAAAGSIIDVSYAHAQAVSPSDSVSIVANTGTGGSGNSGAYPVGLYCGGAGQVSVHLLTGPNCVFTVVQGGYLKVRFDRVNSTGTTAANLVALFG